ncbi:MAG: hypothetical protein KAW12_12550 [Candidatus Aminicenantes bacterium]|nr:hypothetical protein [Candidatus Aminicenantes bacterium]
MGKRNYLREEFTENIIKSLVEDRKSINLIGAKGTGKTRLLEDICSSGLKDVTIVKVDLKAYKRDYSGLLEAIRKQLVLKEKSRTVLPDLSKLSRTCPGAVFCF